MSSSPSLPADSDSTEARNGSVRAEVRPDKLAAYLTVTAPVGDGLPATEGDGLEALQQAGVVAGIDPEAVAAVIRSARLPVDVSGVQESEALVAVGTPPEPGSDAHISHHPLLELEGGTPAITQDGRADFFDLGLVRNVATGTVLATRQLPTPGVAGRTVLGTDLPAKPGRDRLLKAGKGSHVTDDGCQIVADIDGHATLDRDGKVSVLPIFTVPEDVGPATGHINFVGTVVVRGNVMAGYEVKAGQGVEIHGGVDGGRVIAGGSVSVKYGIQGGQAGRVQAGGSVRVRFVENADIQADADVLVQDGILHARVRAGGRVVVSGKRASIIGGHVQARDQITARVLGSTQNIGTEVEVGIDPVLREQRQRIRRELVEADEALTKASQFTKLLRDQEANAGPGGLPPAKVEMLQRAVRSLAFHRQRQEELAVQLRALDEVVAQVKNGRVEALEVAYPGVRVTIGDSQYVVTDEVKRVRFYLGDDELVVFGAI